MPKKIVVYLTIIYFRTCIECITGVRIHEKKQNQTQGYDEMTTFQFSGIFKFSQCQSSKSFGCIFTIRKLSFYPIVIVLFQKLKFCYKIMCNKICYDRFFSHNTCFWEALHEFLAF